MKHLEERNTTYLNHLHFAWKTSGQLLVLVLVGLIHGLIPWFLQNHVSAQIHRINRKLEL
jgi:hypothetical protein